LIGSLFRHSPRKERIRRRYSEPFCTNRNAHCSEVRDAGKPRAINYVMADYAARMLDDATYEVQRELEFEIEAEDPV